MNDNNETGTRCPNWMQRFVRVFFERCPEWCSTKWWQGCAYYDARKNTCVMVIYPLHWVVNFAWWLNMKWSKHRMKQSWIDRQLYR